MITRIQRLARSIFFRSLRNLQDGYLELVCPDETHTFGNDSSDLRVMAVIHDEHFFVRAVTGADVGIGESYMAGEWTSPDTVALVRLAVRNLRLLDAGFPLASWARRTAARWRHRLRGNSLRGSRRNIREHYDLGNGFYKLFLDARMVYSCGIFARPDDALETAQLHKLDLICRKLNLQPGDRVLEIGSGWGAFAFHAAQNYGAHVTGLTLSGEQYSLTSQMISKTGVGSGSVRFLLRDYRNTNGQYDKIVSIEMFEAVGLPRYDEFFAACDRLLAPDGTMLLQFISLPDQEVTAYRKRVDWIQRYIFPGSELGSQMEIHKSLARSTSLWAVQTESFGRHYARTLENWRERFFQNLHRVEKLGFDARFQRMWDFYLCWCEGAFLERYINVVQMLLAKNGTQRPILGDPAPQQRSLAKRVGA